MSVRKFYKLIDGEWKEVPAPFGLGDAVAAVAEPIARALDATLRTKIVGCGGCAKRREKLNEWVPNILR